MSSQVCEAPGERMQREMEVKKVDSGEGKGQGDKKKLSGDRMTC